MKKHKPIQVGDVFPTNEDGSVVVVEYRGADEVEVKHCDEIGHKCIVSASNLRRGAIKNPFIRSVYGVGFLGIGPHPTRSDGKLTRTHSRWRDMIGRCYDQNMHKRSPSYAECSVIEDWHNFQNFADWIVGQKYHDSKDFHLDKDLIVLGNKQYSPETCSLVPREVNNLLLDNFSRRGDLPLGVSFRKDSNRYCAYLNVKGNSTCLGLFDTPDEAHATYAKAKKDYVLKVADEYKSVLHPKVYENLRNWTL